MLKYSRRALLTAALAAPLWTPAWGFTHGGVSLQSIVGVIPAMLNMLPWPGAYAQNSDFNNSQWSKSGCSIGTGITSPSGASNAQHLTEGSASGNHFVYFYAQTNVSNPMVYRLAFITKAAERTRIVPFFVCLEDANASASVGFDLAGGNVGYDVVNGTDASISDYSMTSLGSGWYLCIVDYTFTPTLPGSFTTQQGFYIDAGSGTTARNINYAGDGSSGVDIWWASILPKSAWSINKLSFYDDFNSLSTIDVNNTMNPGYKWYVNNIAPNSPYTTYDWYSRTTSGVTASSTLSISSPSVLKIYNPNNNQNKWTAMIWSVACPDAGGYIGSAFQAPMVFDGYFAFDGSVYQSFFLGPAFWGSSVEALTGVGLVGPDDHFLEWDVMDGVTQVAAFDTLNPSSPMINGFTASANKMGFSPDVFHRISGIWINESSDPSGWGTFLHFLGGQFIPYSDYAYNSSSYPQPPSTNPIGTLSASDQHHLPVFIDTGCNVTNNPGGGWPLYVDWVKVYTK